MKRVAIVAIIVEDVNCVDELNNILHQYRDSIIGRMGIPYPEKNINIISIAMDAEPDTINSLGGKLGRLKGVTTKTLYSTKE